MSEGAGSLICPRCGYTNREGEKRCRACYYDFGRNDQLQEDALYSLPWVYDRYGDWGGRLMITNDRFIHWGYKSYQADAVLQVEPASYSFLIDWKKILQRDKFFADRLEGLKNGTYKGRLFSAADAEVGKPLKELQPELRSLSPNDDVRGSSAAIAKHVHVIYQSDVKAMILYDVLSPKGFWGNRTGELIGLELHKGEGHLSLIGQYVIPLLGTQELADMLRRTPLADAELKFDKPKKMMRASLIASHNLETQRRPGCPHG